MKFFLRTDDAGAVTRWLERGVLDGIVTPGPAAAHLRLPDAGPAPVHIIEVDGPDADVSAVQARRTSRVVDVPMLDETSQDNLRAVNAWSRSGLTVSVSGCMAVGQVLLAWRAGATFARLRWSDIVEDGGDPIRIAANCTQWGGLRGPGQLLLLDCVRTVGDYYDALRTSADGVIVSDDLLCALTRYAQRPQKGTR